MWTSCELFRKMMHAPKGNPRLRGVRLLGMAQKLSGQLRHSQKDKMINIPFESSNTNAKNPHAACVSIIVPAFWQNMVDGISYLCFLFCLVCPRFLILFRDSAQELVTGKGPCLQCANKCLYRGHANLFCSVAILSDDRRRGSNFNAFGKICTQGAYRRSQGQQQHVV